MIIETGFGVSRNLTPWKLEPSLKTLNTKYRNPMATVLLVKVQKPAAILFYCNKNITLTQATLTFRFV